MRTRTRAFLKPISVFWVIHVIFLKGCIKGDKIIFPVKVDHPANTFRLSEKDWGGRVASAKVFNRNKSEVLWHIKAVNDIPVKGFVITVGKVPGGFRQVVPAIEKDFSPVRGEEYVIEVMCWDLSPPAFLGERTWMAD